MTRARILIALVIMLGALALGLDQLQGAVRDPRFDHGFDAQARVLASAGFDLAVALAAGIGLRRLRRRLRREPEPALAPALARQLAPEPQPEAPSEPETAAQYLEDVLIES